MARRRRSRRTVPWEASLGLHPGELVDVRSREEILATLDKDGCLERMPFMPEMLQYCGRRLRVLKRAEKSCDTVLGEGSRRVYDAVHLEGARCDGAAHGGCQARCLLWWREAWLRRVTDAPAQVATLPPPACTEQDLERATHMRGLLSAEIFRCQATRMLEFTYGLRWFDPRPVVREVRCGNVSKPEALKVLAHAAMNMLRRRLGQHSEPHVSGRCESSTPAERIPDLKPGDWVEVKSQQEIEATLDRHQRNRGLLFDIEMLPYCGRRMRLLARVDHIIHERTGAMRSLPNDCWIIEGAVCSGLLSRNRLFCTRQIYGFWREAWLRRVDGPEPQPDGAVARRLERA